jgi:hydrazine synthase alpha subunit-like protein
MIRIYGWLGSCSIEADAAAPALAPTSGVSRMSRHLSRFRAAGALCLLFGLALLPGCSTKSGDDDGAGNVSRIVYAVRQHTAIDAEGTVSIDVAGGMGQVMDYGRYMPGGRLEVFDLKTSNVQANIIEDYPTADVSSVDVSFDATQVVFTMKRDAQDNYHVFTAGVDRAADGKFAVTQLTFGPYDDQQAIFSPGGRIVFTTNQSYTEMGTRADEYNHARAVTQLATITTTGGDADRKLCSQNLSHIITLFSMHDGRVGFSRWEHLENVNDVKLFAMNPDCTQIVALSGQHGKPGNSMVQVTESNTPNVFYGIVTNRENTIQAGALVKLDARSDNPLALGQFDEEKSQEQAYSILTPAVPRSDEPSPGGRYRSPSTLPDGRVMVSWAKGNVDESNELSLSPPDYGIYWYDQSGSSTVNHLIVNDEHVWELYARPITARAEPAIIPPIQHTADASTPTTFGSIDIRETSLSLRHNDSVSGAQFSSTPTAEALAAATRVRIIEGFSTEGSPNHTMFGLTMAEGAAILGEAKVEQDGSWLANIPPYVPVHLQPIDEFDLSIRSQTTWIQGMPGESRVCGGCHEDRNQANLPSVGSGALTIAAGRGPENFMKPVDSRTEYPWAKANDASNPNEIQALLNAKCVSCHNGTTNGDKPQEFYTLTMANAVLGTSTEYQVARMDLTDTPVTVYYDRQVASWPSSYVSLFYPAALSMEMGKVTVTGKVPPKWAIPSDARNSLLIEKLNVTSIKSSSTYAWPLDQPFTDADVAGGKRTDHAKLAGLTRDELVKLIRTIDMGGQYYARQNSDFKPFGAGDPVGGKY